MAFANPARSYRYRVEVDGIDQWAIQKVTLPEESLTIVEHGGGDRNIKTASKHIIADAVFEKLVAADSSYDLWGKEWMELCIKGTPDIYKRNLVVKLLGNDGLTTIKTWLLIGCFPNKLTRADLDRMADENFMETLTLSVDDCREL